jgi:hypothetical protein
MYGLSLPLWYLQTLQMNHRYFRRFTIHVVISIFLWSIFLSWASHFLLVFLNFNWYSRARSCKNKFFNSRIQERYSIRGMRNLNLIHFVRNSIGNIMCEWMHVQSTVRKSSFSPIWSWDLCILSCVFLLGLL